MKNNKVTTTNIIMDKICIPNLEPIYFKFIVLSYYDIIQWFNYIVTRFSRTKHNLRVYEPYCKISQQFRP